MKGKCKVTNCGRTDIRAKGYCKKHYERYRQGKDPDAKTIKDKNDYVEHTNTIEIILRDKNHQKVASTFIDKEDKWLLNYKWHLHNKGYASAYINGNNRKHLHQFLFPRIEEMDHINRDRLDNRKSNLRECSTQQNLRNKNKYKNNRSGYRGITKTNDGRWRARINVNRKSINLGRFNFVEDAIKARKEAEKKHFKEFAPK